MTVQYLTGDVVETVQALPDNSVDLVACSPPFWMQRDYGDGLPGQWGHEPTPAAFIDHLLDLVEVLQPKLAEHGSIAFELGDTFAGSGGAGGDYGLRGMRSGQRRPLGSAAAGRKWDRVQREGHAAPLINRNGWHGPGGPGVPGAKSLCGTPTLFAWSLAYGRNLLRPDRTTEPWLIRNVIAWARNNPSPGALADKYRPATSYITVATRSPKRWFDLEAVRKPAGPNSHARAPKGVKRQPKKGKATAAGRGGNWATMDEVGEVAESSPPLDHWADEYGDVTWLINTAPSSLAHYAMWPATLAERLILSMCPAHVCRECGEPRRRIVHADPSPISAEERKTRPGANGIGTIGRRHNTIRRNAMTLGWSDCGHNRWRPGVVLDPFAGSGTTLAVADIHGRDAIGIDLDPANEGLYPARYAECWRALKPNAGLSPVTANGTQLDLLAQP